MTTREERRLQARIDALSDELESRKTTSQRQSDVLTGNGRNELDDEPASETSRAQAEQATRGRGGRRWTSEESPAPRRRRGESRDPHGAEHYWERGHRFDDDGNLVEIERGDS